MAEIILSIIILGLLGVFMNFEPLLMPMSMVTTFSLALIISFFFFMTIVWREKAHDERENLHKLFAGRISFLVGSVILVLGIIVQAYHHNVDPWLIYTLGGMILSKLFIHLYQRYKM